MSNPMTATYYAGLDVCKAYLSVAARHADENTAEIFTVANDCAGVEALVSRLR